jgi:hypothetical protein
VIGMKKWIIIFICAWQAIVFILIAMGIYVDIYRLFRIPWNSVGWLNFVGCVIGFLLLEIPAMAALWWLLAIRKT